MMPSRAARMIWSATACFGSIEVGSISLHPSGFIHGPQPGSVEASIGKAATDEYAVMIDTFRPLGLGDAALACEDSGYAWTWVGGTSHSNDSTSG